MQSLRLSAQALWSRVVIGGPFPKLTQSLFGNIIRSLAGHDLVAQCRDGTLILGNRGEALVSHYDFFATFLTAEEYRVTHGGSAIGTIPAMVLPKVQDHLILAAKRWRVSSIFHDRHEIIVVPARGSKPTRFAGASSGMVHPRVRTKMRDLLRDVAVPRYLNDTAIEMLDHGTGWHYKWLRDIGFVNNPEPDQQGV